MANPHKTNFLIFKYEMFFSSLKFFLTTANNDSKNFLSSLLKRKFLDITDLKFKIEYLVLSI